MKQNEYRNSLEEIQIGDKENPNRELNADEYKQFHGMVGKIQWLNKGTRPDLAFNTLTMSMKTKKAVVKDMRKLNKIVWKVKEGDSTIRFKRIRNMEDIKIIAMADASLKTMEEKVAPVEGRVIFLSDGTNASPL